MTKRLCLFLFASVFTLSSQVAYAQKQPVSWNIYADSLRPETATIVFKASVVAGWHLYSQFIGDGGPMPTTFEFDKGAYEILGTTHETGKRTTFHDPTYDMEISWYDNLVTFSQTIRYRATTTVKGSIDYMVCNNEICMPGRKTFAVFVALPEK